MLRWKKTLLLKKDFGKRRIHYVVLVKYVIACLCARARIDRLFLFIRWFCQPPSSQHSEVAAFPGFQTTTGVEQPLTSLLASHRDTSKSGRRRGCQVGIFSEPNFRKLGLGFKSVGLKILVGLLASSHVGWP